MPLVLAIADDLTGALEAGAKFAGQGIPARVTAGPAPAGDFPVTVIDTESRRLPAAEAAAAVAAAAGADAPLIYKKTDSTLRGNVSAELRALARAYPDARIAYAPAYPALGRTVKGGRLHVHGEPVHLTWFGADPQNPVASSDVAQLLGDCLPCTVYDGETDADVARAVAEALAAGCRIIAGPASVADALAAQLEFPRRPAAPWPAIRTCLLVNGSLHEASARQIAFAQACGCASELPGSPWRVFRPAIRAGLAPLEIAAETGRLVRQSLDAAPVDALVVFGGDTAFGILKALGSPALEPVGELATGVPLSRVVGRDLCLITKAGGFGEDNLLRRLKQKLDATEQR